MIQKELIDLISSRTSITQRYFIEKDLILHRLLVELSANESFCKNYVFKGGTCLMKCYFPYFRFSEDLDFTYIHQNEFEKKTENHKRKIMSERINEVMLLVKNISNTVGLDFKPIKNDIAYIEFGGSNKQITFKLWYVSEGSTEKTFIKIQINFFEKLYYPFVKKRADNFFFGKFEPFKEAFLLNENSEWLLKIPELICYDLKEILIEKIRAILTRRGTKARDYIDVYMIEKKEKLNVEKFKNQIIEKIAFVLKFEKYKINLSKKQPADFMFDRREEEKILLIPLPRDFEAFFDRLKPFLVQVAYELNKK